MRIPGYVLTILNLHQKCMVDALIETVVMPKAESRVKTFFYVMASGGLYSFI